MQFRLTLLPMETSQKIKIGEQTFTFDTSFAQRQDAPVILDIQHIPPTLEQFKNILVELEKRGSKFRGYVELELDEFEDKLKKTTVKKN